MKRKTKLLSVLLTLTMGIATMGTMASCGLFDSDKNSSSSSNIGTPHNGNSSNANTDQDDLIPPTGTQGLKYTLSDDKTYYSVSGYKGTATTVYIPDTYEDLPVKAIGYDPFEDCENVTRIIIGNNVTSISDYAFVSCLNLTNISVSENNTEYKSIDGNLYSANGKKLIRYAIGKTETTFTIPNGVIFIDDSAFSQSNNLTEIVIPDSVTSIGEQVFASCDNLTEIVIPDSVTFIAEHAFWGVRYSTIYCQADSQPDGWDSDWNSYLRPVIWDCDNNDIAEDGYIYIMKNGVRYALKDGEATVIEQAPTIISANILSEIAYKNVSYTVTFIDSYAFDDCDNLTEIVIPEGVTSIGHSAFYDCDSLTSVVIGNGVTYIGSIAFAGCDSLASVTIGGSVTSIGLRVFYNCDSLASVKFEDTSTWYVTDSYTYLENKTGGTQVSVTDYDTNAMYFTDIYDYDYYWYKL